MSHSPRSIPRAAVVAVAASAALSAQTVGFPGVPALDFCIRNTADACIAASPMAVVHTVNSQIGIYEPGSLVFRAFQYMDTNPNMSGFRTFFGEVGATRIVDTKVVFDTGTQRFYVVGLQQDGPLVPPGQPGIYVARSESQNPVLWIDPSQPVPPPSGNWRPRRTLITGLAIPGLPGVPVTPDFCGLAVDDTRLIYSGVLVDANRNGLGHLYRIFQKSAVDSTIGTLTPVDVITGGRAPFELPQPAQNFDPAPDAILVGTDPSSAALRLVAIRPDNSVVEQTVGVPAFLLPGPADGAQQAPTTQVPNPPRLDILDGRIQNCVVRDGKLWACHTVWSSFTTAGKAVVRWYRFALNGWPAGGTPVLEESGTLDLGNNTAGNPIHTFFPAIMPDRNGSAGMVFARSAANEPPSVWRAGKAPNSPAGSFGTSAQISTGASGVNLLGPNGTARWGDWFCIALDPFDTTRFYCAGTIAKNSGVFPYCNPPLGFSSMWQAILATFKVNDPGAVTAFGVGAPGTNGITPFHNSVTTTAKLGTTMQLRVQNSTTFGVGAIGAWALATAPSPAPIPVFNGQIFLDPASLVLLNYVHSTTVEEILQLPLPFDLSLINTRIFSQCMNVDTNFDTSFTNALNIRIGLP